MTKIISPSLLFPAISLLASCMAMKEPVASNSSDSTSNVAVSSVTQSSSSAARVKVVFPPQGSDVSSGDPRRLEVIVSAPLDVTSVDVAGVALNKSSKQPHLWRGYVDFTAEDSSSYPITVDGINSEKALIVFNTDGNNYFDSPGFGTATKDIRLSKDQSSLLFTRSDGLYKFDFSSGRIDLISEFQCGECDIALDDSGETAYILSTDEQISKILTYHFPSEQMIARDLTDAHGRPLMPSESLEFARGKLYSSHKRADEDRRYTWYEIDPKMGVASAENISSGVHMQVDSIASDVHYNDALNIGFTYYSRVEYLTVWERLGDSANYLGVVNAAHFISRSSSVDNAQIFFDHWNNLLYVTNRSSLLSAYDMSDFVAHLDEVRTEPLEQVFRGLRSGNSVPIMSTGDNRYGTLDRPHQNPYYNERDVAAPAPAIDVHNGVAYIMNEGELEAINLQTGERVTLAH